MMKKLWYCFAVLMTLCLTSCYEVNEEITINDKGVGTFAAKMDMSQMLQMLQSFGGAEDMSQNGLDRVIDTTVYLKDAVDSAKDVTPERKRLVHDGSVKIRMNAKENIFNTDVNLPFKSYGDLQQLMSGSAMRGMAKAMKHEFSPSGEEGQSAMGDQLMDEMNEIFDVTVNSSQIARKINTAKVKALLDRPEMAQMKMLTSAGIEIWYTTVIKLPRPVKKFENDLVKLSDDKKTVTIKYDMLKLLDTPEKFSYSIYY